MTTPVYDYIMEYVRRGDLRMHMPGHKGKGFGGWLGTAYPLDITEICGADSLFEANGILAESEQHAAELFGVGATVYSAGGSTLCIQGMLLQMKREGRTILAGRNAHRSFLNACILLDCPVRWMYPQDGTLLSGVVAPETVRRMLASVEGSACVYLTTPDYLGGMADVAQIAAICKAAGATLLVDNAHGAHLAFETVSRHPIALGADYCCDSYHKFLPALTGAACVHCKRAEDAPAIRAAMAMFGSTSPSYLILASMDVCNQYLAHHVRHDVFSVSQRILRLKRRLKPFYAMTDGDLFHLCFRAAFCGLSGMAFAEWLVQQGVMYEYADEDNVILLCAPRTPLTDIDRLEQILLHCPLPRTRMPNDPAMAPRLTTALSMREAAFAPTEWIPVEACEGRICAMTQPPCPPAVPMVICGELLDASCIALFSRYGMQRVPVVQTPMWGHPAPERRVIL